MTTRGRGSKSFAWAIAASAAIGVSAESRTALGVDGPPMGPAGRVPSGTPADLGPLDRGAITPSTRPLQLARVLNRRRPATRGTLGYGPPGPQPGHPGFGLGYFPGYGFGGAGLGVGAEGGYPLYGGPGYPHPAPRLRRVGGIAPFCFYGGPGGPAPGAPNFYGAPATPLAPDTPVVSFEGDSPELAGLPDYGSLTGTVPYPETTFAPYASSGGDRSPALADRPEPPRPADEVPAEADQALGLETEATVDSGLARSLKVTRLRPGGAADKAGLAVGDVIRAANGYLTEQPGNLSWVVANAAPDRKVRLTIVSARTGEARSVTLDRP